MLLSAVEFTRGFIDFSNNHGSFQSDLSMLTLQQESPSSYNGQLWKNILHLDSSKDLSAARKGDTQLKVPLYPIKKGFLHQNEQFNLTKKEPLNIMEKNISQAKVKLNPTKKGLSQSSELLGPTRNGFNQSKEPFHLEPEVVLIRPNQFSNLRNETGEINRNSPISAGDLKAYEINTSKNGRNHEEGGVSKKKSVGLKKASEEQSRISGREEREKRLRFRYRQKLPTSLRRNSFLQRQNKLQKPNHSLNYADKTSSIDHGANKTQQRAVQTTTSLPERDSTDDAHQSDFSSKIIRRDAVFPDGTSSVGGQREGDTLPFVPSIADLGRRSKLPSFRRAQALRQNRDNPGISELFTSPQGSAGVPLDTGFGLRIGGAKGGALREVNSHQSFNNNTALFFTILDDDDDSFDFSREFSRHDDHFRPNPLLTLVPPHRAANHESNFRPNGESGFVTSERIKFDESKRPSVFHRPNGGTNQPIQIPFNESRNPKQSPFQVSLDIDTEDKGELGSFEQLPNPLFISPASNGRHPYLVPPPIVPQPPPQKEALGRDLDVKFSRFQSRQPQLLRKAESLLQENYQFGYEVQSDGTSHGHREERKGHRVEGVYHVDLPNGYRQIVKYYADETGYHPTITYEKLFPFGSKGPSNVNGVPSTLITELVPPPPPLSEDYTDTSMGGSSRGPHRKHNPNNFKSIIFPLTFSSSDNYEITFPHSDDPHHSHTGGGESPTLYESTYDSFDDSAPMEWGNKEGPSSFYKAPPTTAGSTTTSTAHPSSEWTTLVPTTTPEPPIIDPEYIRIKSLPNDSPAAVVLGEANQ